MEMPHFKPFKVTLVGLSVAAAIFVSAVALNFVRAPDWFPSVGGPRIYPFDGVDLDDGPINVVLAPSEYAGFWHVVDDQDVIRSLKRKWVIVEDKGEGTRYLFFSILALSPPESQSPSPLMFIYRGNELLKTVYCSSPMCAATKGPAYYALEQASMSAWREMVHFHSREEAERFGKDEQSADDLLVRTDTLTTAMSSAYPGEFEIWFGWISEQPDPNDREAFERDIDQWDGFRHRIQQFFDVRRIDADVSVMVDPTDLSTSGLVLPGKFGLDARHLRFQRIAVTISGGMGAYQAFRNWAIYAMLVPKQTPELEAVKHWIADEDGANCGQCKALVEQGFRPELVVGDYRSSGEFSVEVLRYITGTTSYEYGAAPLPGLQDWVERPEVEVKAGN